MSHVFISYAREDEQWAALLQHTLRQSGFEVWMPHPDLRYYVNEWRANVSRAIKEAFAVIVIITPNADKSSYLEYEWELAERLSRPVIPAVFSQASEFMARYPGLPPLDFSQPGEYPWRSLARTLIRAAQGALTTLPRAGRETLDLFPEEDTQKVERTQILSVQEMPPPESGVVITAFGPKAAEADTWYALLVYFHTEAALEQVRADARRRLENVDNLQFLGHIPAPLRHGAEMTIQPMCAGVIFNPECIGLRYLEDVHCAEFRFRAEPEAAQFATITIYRGLHCGGAMAAEIMRSLRVELAVHPGLEVEPDSE